MRILAVSYSITFNALLYRRVAVDDLNDALFYFGCVRWVTFEPRQVDRMFPHAPQHERQRIHSILTQVMLAAEKEGRIVWREGDAKLSFRELNELLTTHGYRPLVIGRRESYDLPTVKKMVENQLRGEVEVLYF